MRAALCLLVAAAVICPTMASANEKVATQIGEPVPAVNCDLSGLGVYSSAGFLAVPDCGGAVRTTPISVAGAGVAGSVIVAVDLDHTWMGDMNLSVSHDADCNGTAETSATLLCRTGLFDPSCPSSGCCGCSDDLGGVYTFDDASSGAVLGDPFSGCYGGFAVPGCYKPVTGLAAFSGSSADGCWFLTGQDGACGDLFYINGWTLYVGAGGTATENVSWSTIKASYK